MNLIAVCSNKPRPSVQGNAKGNQYWRRDVFHASKYPALTVCGKSSPDWLVINGVTIDDMIKDHNFCKNCRRRLPCV